MKGKEHLPIYGVGPVCGISMTVFLLIGLFLRNSGCLDSGNAKNFRIPFQILGVLFILLGIYIWTSAVIGSKIDKAIKENRLLKTGIYAKVRNPIYSAIAFALTGIALMFYNFWLLILPFLFWLDITVLMKATEEKWLLKIYKGEYIEYCSKVNRCIPNFFKKHRKGKEIL